MSIGSTFDIMDFLHRLMLVDWASRDGGPGLCSQNLLDALSNAKRELNCLAVRGHQVITSSAKCNHIKNLFPAGTGSLSKIISFLPCLADVCSVYTPGLVHPGLQLDPWLRHSSHGLSPSGGPSIPDLHVQFVS